ncbi:ABC transporter ATP-binding protein [Flavobacteriaceae bacterium S0825]|uniref:ABC transporter ATP-binding protein n=1 Tax=Gaetbulibacter sp. S0825 TaxID=2720084 RepID=UPI001430307F|nr:ABC transporter ATP-binding protein [Gaetbulibacter sp. S0825]MCK0109751.1 ABC transporter ATP-binding protein [Flavobacteriaceae bacterium S0825]NIX65383.1 ABC transporter ATP-binding protein [Gaetbulibacter sp. S0825]
MIHTNIIDVQNLSFAYSKSSKIILDDISMKVPKGAIYGFLGANGAGKSTTMQLLTGSIFGNSGTIHLFEKPLEPQLPSVFNKIGCLIDSPSLYYHLSGYDNLHYIATLKKTTTDNITEVLDLVGLSESAHQKVKEYSLGMKQRLAVSMALLGNPELLLLDEPINGLDPQGVIDIRNLLIKLNKERGITIFISSHLLDEIEKICTHIGILNKGKLVFDDTIDVLKQKSGRSQKVMITLKDAKQYVNPLKDSCNNIYLKGSTLSIEVDTKEAIDSILLKLIELGAHIVEVKTNEDLEDLFLNLSK